MPTDNAHAFDKVGPNIDSAENWSAALKTLKPRVLKRLIDAHKCGLPLSHRSLARVLLSCSCACKASYRISVKKPGSPNFSA